MADVANASFIGRAFDRARLAALADWLAVAVAVALPWSTTVSEIFIVLWLLALLPTFTLADLRREFASAAGGLPGLLWLAGALGMLWAQVSLHERFAGLGGFHKLLVIPLLLAQFRRSGRGLPVLYGFVISCSALLIASWATKIIWDIRGADGFFIRDKLPGVPVRDYIAQSAEFIVCVFGLSAAAYEAGRLRRVGLAAMLGALALLFLANVLTISPSRSVLVVIPFLIAAWGAREFGWKGLAGAALAAGLIAGIAWSVSPSLRARVNSAYQEVQTYQSDNAVTSAGLRLEFWKKSMSFIVEAPLFGNGTGSMPQLFRRASQGAGGAEGVASVNPHNQYLAVAIQLGLFGLAILIAMWGAHFLLFRGPGLVSWLGLAMVLQNVISSAFNSHLFDSLHGWLYVFGVGVLGGMVLHQRHDAGGGTA